MRVNYSLLKHNDAKVQGALNTKTELTDWGL
jgi:hypothetical protein